MTHYRIVVRGRLGPCWSGEFGDLRVLPGPDGTTELRGHVRDQSELHGQLRRIEGLGLTLVSVSEDGGAP